MADHETETRPCRVVVLELNLVAGLGYSVPLATRGDDGVGAIAPFMLEAGLSSTAKSLPSGD